MTGPTIRSIPAKEACEDFFTCGIIHSYKILAEIKTDGHNLNDVDFEELIDLQRRNLSDPGMKIPVVKVNEETEPLK